MFKFDLQLFGGGGGGKDGGKIIGSAIAMEIVKTWMTTEYLGHTEEKYRRRVGKVQEIAEKHLKKFS